MATVAPKFAPGPVLSHGSPRSPPPPKLPGYGDSCFRATCYLETREETSEDVRRLASFIGYDTTLDIIGEVEGMCRLHAKKHPNSRCSETRLTFLGATSQECSGQVYFHYERP